jgi:hypothetical protein
MSPDHWPSRPKAQGSWKLLPWIIGGAVTVLLIGGGGAALLIALFKPRPTLEELLAKAPDTFSDEGALDVPGLLSIKSPARGFQWQQTQASDIARSYVCKKGGSKDALTLVVYLSGAPTEGHRSTQLKAVWNAAVDTYRAQGFEIGNARKPALDSPIPAQVPYSISGRRADGTPYFVHGLVMFRQRTYAFQALSENSESAVSLLAVLKSVKDSPKGQEAALEQSEK